MFPFSYKIKEEEQRRIEEEERKRKEEEERLRKEKEEREKREKEEAANNAQNIIKSDTTSAENLRMKIFSS